jgi:long-subunit acyl-CoA synthetase (AMP-forming)
MKNISKLFLNQINKQPTKIILKQKENNIWKGYTYQDLLYKINDCNEKLNNYNIKKNQFYLYE